MIQILELIQQVRMLPAQHHGADSDPEDFQQTVQVSSQNVSPNHLERIYKTHIILCINLCVYVFLLFKQFSYLGSTIMEDNCSTREI